jgi:hypothetical protein
MLPLRNNKLGEFQQIIIISRATSGGRQENELNSYSGSFPPIPRWFAILVPLLTPIYSDNDPMVVDDNIMTVRGVVLRGAN